MIGVAARFVSNVSLVLQRQDRGGWHRNLDSIFS